MAVEMPLNGDEYHDRRAGYLTRRLERGAPA